MLKEMGNHLEESRGLDSSLWFDEWDLFVGEGNLGFSWGLGFINLRGAVGLDVQISRR